MSLNRNCSQRPPSCPYEADYLSTFGIEQLVKRVEELAVTYNKYATDSRNKEWKVISPKVLGVLFTMIGIRNGQAYSAQQQYIEQVVRLQISMTEMQIRENKTIYADAPEYGVPVVLKRVSGKTYESAQQELETLTTEILRKTVS